MKTDEARYEAIDPQARGPEAVTRAFENQIAYCRDNGAPITAGVNRGLRELIDTDRGGTVMLRVRKWAGAPLADALPLRLAGGLHALHLTGAEQSLAPIYDGLDPNDTADLLANAIERHEAFLLPWLDGPPQTNEAGRSWGYAAAMLWLADRGLPRDFALYEIGSSAGINLMMRRYRYDLGGVTVGPDTSGMRLSPEWHGPSPSGGGFDIVGAKGCDIAPVDLTDPDQALRLRAYVWPEFTERFHRLDAAIEAANRYPPEIERRGAGDFVDDILAAEPQPGVTRALVHSVVWQYIGEDERRRITLAMERAGEAATKDSPLAWISLEANRDTHRHELNVRYWPGGDQWRHLGTAHPHGAWVEWTG
ncbi:DUF2332 domain-containing protein [Qipengyuania sp. MTN3-11]|uniref:DUF2332 domain-containing protein n=1 Tax=Qipengyuania sp. MTN3-11 TaxID=3056557 RepID=UPI0036F442F6